MKYTILSTKTVGEVLVTEVHYSFANGMSTTVPVSHFQPSTVADIELGIVNRAASEKRRLKAEAKNAELLAQIVSNQEVTADEPNGA
jgi:hypothetical protein